MILKFWFEEIDRSQWWSKTMSLISEYVKDLQRFMQKQFAVSFIIGERTQQGDWLKLLFWINSQEICLEIHLCLSRMIHWLWRYLKKQFQLGQTKS